MHAIDALGWSAASLMLLAFLCRDPRRLRGVAILANISFIAYGAEAGMWPVLGLHAVLLPLNAWRLMTALRDSSDEPHGWQRGPSSAEIGVARMGVATHAQSHDPHPAGTVGVRAVSCTPVRAARAERAEGRDRERDQLAEAVAFEPEADSSIGGSDDGPTPRAPRALTPQNSIASIGVAPQWAARAPGSMRPY